MLCFRGLMARRWEGLLPFRQVVVACTSRSRALLRMCLVFLFARMLVGGWIFMFYVTAYVHDVCFQTPFSVHDFIPLLYDKIIELAGGAGERLPPVSISAVATRSPSGAIFDSKTTGLAWTWRLAFFVYIFFLLAQYTVFIPICPFTTYSPNYSIGASKSPTRVIIYREWHFVVYIIAIFFSSMISRIESRNTSSGDYRTGQLPSEIHNALEV